MNTSTQALHADIPRQRWLRIIPPILIACIISYMDRVNIAFAMPGGMDEELGISATMAGLAGGIFFIGYLFLQVPGGDFGPDRTRHQPVSTAGAAFLTRGSGRRDAAGCADDDQ